MGGLTGWGGVQNACNSGHTESRPRGCHFSGGSWMPCLFRALTWLQKKFACISENLLEPVTLTALPATPGKSRKWTPWFNRIQMTASGSLGKDRDNAWDSWGCSRQPTSAGVRGVCEPPRLMFQQPSGRKTVRCAFSSSGRLCGSCYALSSRVVPLWVDATFLYKSHGFG